MTPPTCFTSVNEAVKHAESARELVLSDRHLRTLPKSIAKLTKLETLDVSGNPLHQLPDWLFDLKTIRALNLRCTGLNEIPREIRAFQALEVLEVGGDDFTQLPPTLTELSHLRVLNINTVAELRTVPDLSALRSLQELSLDWAPQLTNLTEAIAQLPPLHTLLLRNVPLTVFPDKASSLSALRNLKLSRTQLTRLPSWIGSLDKLETLSIDENQKLATLPDELGNLQTLRSLHIEMRTVFPKLPAALGKLTCLEKLVLNTCRLEEIPDWVFDLEALRELFVAINPLKRVAPGISKLKNLRSLHLGLKPEIYPHKAEIQSWLPECNVDLTGEAARVVSIDEIMGRAPVVQARPAKPRVSARDVSTTNDWSELHGIEKWVCLSDAEQLRITTELATRLGTDVEILQPTPINLFPRLKDPITDIVWIAVAGEEFQMGLSTSDKQALTRLTKNWSDEAKEHVEALVKVARPAHKVFVPPFLCAEKPMLAHQVQGISDTTVMDGVCLFEPLAAAEYAERLRARLLSEAEWEYIARHRDSRSWISMEDDSRKHDPRKFVENALQKGLNGETGFLFGVRGLGWGTWVEDSWHANYEGAPNAGESWEPHEIPEVVRGGAYQSWPWQMDGEALLMHAAHREQKPNGKFPLLLARNLPARHMKK